MQPRASREAPLPACIQAFRVQLPGSALETPRTRSPYKHIAQSRATAYEAVGCGVKSTAHKHQDCTSGASKLRRIRDVGPASPHQRKSSMHSRVSHETPHTACLQACLVRLQDSASLVR